MYSLEEKAIKLVTKAFEGKRRKKLDIDASVHSITVGYFLKDSNENLDVVVAGFLHDIIEDTDYDYEYIKTNYNENIANLVSGVSENKEIKDWKERKVKFIERITNSSDDIIKIELADKFHNLIFDYEIWLEQGNDALTTKNTTYELSKWYYTSFYNIFNDRIPNHKLLPRYKKLIELYF